MDDGLTIDASAYSENEWPVKAGDWLASGEPMVRIAQVRRVWRDSDWDGHTNEGFLVDLYIYDRDGNKIGRESDVGEPFECMGKIIRGPRTFEPACALYYWYRIEKPVFPLKFGWVTTSDGKRVLGNVVEPRQWGKYVRRKIKSVLPVVPVRQSDFDPELERRARLLAAEMLRDVARDRGGDAELKQKAESLEDEARRMTEK